MNYGEWIDYLKNAQMFGKKVGLENISKLMEQLGNPQEQLNIIHVGGTNGKGSVCAMLTSVLMEEGYRVGTFTSPHLIHYNERLRINLKPIDDKEFQRIGEKIVRAIGQMVELGYHHPTFFEIVTACALTYFHEKKVDFVILEVGLGGRLDATNVIKKPLVSVITPISLDHTQILGETLEEIAEEKCGIVKKNCPLVLYSVNRRVYNKVNKVTREKNAKLYTIDQSILIDILSRNLHEQVFSIKTQYYEYKNLKISLLGNYQIINSAILLLTIHVLRQKAIKISDRALYTGLKNARWPGRMELISHRGLHFMLDGAHNYAGMKSFLESISQLIKPPIHFIVGFNKDKEYKRMMDLIATYNHKGIKVFTSAISTKSVKRDDIHDVTNDFIYTHNLKEAYEVIKKEVKEGGYICCVGSLYLVGEMRELLLKEKEVDTND